MVVTATEQPTKLKIHGNHRRSSFCCVIGIRSFTSAALQCGDIPVRPVGTPTAIIPVASRVKEESSCKIHYRQSGVSLLGACHRRQGERDEELCPNAVYAHDPALIPEQARGNMAACTTTERRGLGGREVVLHSTVLGYFRAFTGDRNFHQVFKWQVQEIGFVLPRM